ncbi:hypothetical protein [Zavarzinella formosa]|uniref:hypothetical protein n=1 Tax=Zavarzinella formosa TaxID=360055 RepID=UPI0002DF87D6|nr:hypothetical protein [Zavarzinella formosa]
MIRYCVVAIVCVIGSLNLRADETSNAAEAKKLASLLAEATKAGDYAKVIDHTYPAAVEFAGGREKAISLIEAAMKKVKEDGIVIKEISVGEPGEFFTEGKNTFFVIPLKTVMTVPAGTVRSKSYLLGISPDDGKTWTFMDGVGLQNPLIWDKVLPKMPEKLQLPVREKPEFTKDK